MPSLFEALPQGATKKWHINPLNVTLIRPIEFIDGTEGTEILLVNTLGASSSVVVESKEDDVRMWINQALR